jgi:hypothetical protein
MSRIFDALQKSELEGDSPDFLPMSLLPAEVPPAVGMTDLMEDEPNDFAPSDVGQFQSVAIKRQIHERLGATINQM